MSDRIRTQVFFIYEGIGPSVFTDAADLIIVKIQCHISLTLFQIGCAECGAGFFSGLIECGEKHTCKNRNNCDYNQKFNQCETSDSMYSVMFFELVFHIFILSVQVVVLFFFTA